MKIVFPFIALLLAASLPAALSQENQPTTPVEKKPVPAQPAGGPSTASEAPKPVPKAEAEEEAPKKYVVQSGDNPWLIAKNHGVSLDALLRLNEIKDPKNLKIGDVLLLPEGVTSKNAPKEKTGPKAAAGPQSGDGWELYTIKSGDNPWTISKKLQVDHRKILSLNEGLNFRDLKIGQQIKVPKK